MKKKIILLLILLPFAFGLRAQLIQTSFPDKYAYPSTQVNIPVLVQNFNDVASVSLVFTYSNIVLSYQNYQNVNPAFSSGLLVNKMAVGDTDRVVVSWFNLSPVNLGSDTLMEFAFTYNGGTTTLSWDTINFGNCQYTNLDEVVLGAVFENGTISPVQPNSTLLPVMTAVPGSDILVPVTVANFNDVAHIELKMDYDTNVLNYLGYQSVHPLLASGNLSITEGIQSIMTSWDSISSILNIGDDTLYILRFNYLGGISELAWDTITAGACQYLGVTSNLLPSNFYNGSVSSSVIQLQLGSTSVCNGSSVTIPVSVNNGNNIGSFSLTFTYVDSLVQYTNYQALHPSLSNGFTIVSTGNSLTLNWSDTAAVSLGNAMILELNFSMQTSSGGFTNLSWNNAISVFQNGNGQNIPVNFVGGSISINPYLNLGPDKEVCIYNTTSLYAGDNFTSYLWSTGGTSSTTIVDSTHGSGYYFVTVTDVNGCTGIDSIYVFFSPCVGIEEVSPESQLIVYPNPSADGSFTIVFKAGQGSGRMTIVDLSGRLLLEKVIDMQDGIEELQLKNYPPGVYFLKLISDRQIITKRLIVR